MLGIHVNFDRQFEQEVLQGLRQMQETPNLTPECVKELVDGIRGKIDQRRCGGGYFFRNGCGKLLVTNTIECDMVKINMRNLPCEEVLKLLRLKHRDPLQPSEFLATVLRIVSASSLWETGFTYTTELLELIGDQSCLILMNHTSFAIEPVNCR